MARSKYNPANWYWLVADGPPDQIYSSAAANYLPLTDAGYVAWLANDNTATNIDSAASLVGVLADAYPAGQAGVSPAGKSASFNAKLATVIAGGFRYDFSHYSTDKSIAVSTLTPNGTAGLLTIQMDQESQIAWCVLLSQAQLAIAASAPTTPFLIRVFENVNVTVPASDIPTILGAAAAWASQQLFICAGLKDQLTALTGTTAAMIAAMAAINWPS